MTHGQADVARERSIPRLLDLAAWSVLLAITLVAIAWLRTRHIAEIQALSGFDLLGMMHPIWDLPQFGRDFPNGEAEIMNSLASQLLRIAGRIGLPDVPTLWFAVFAEAGVLATGAWLLARTVWPDAPRWQHAATALLLVSGNIASNDLGRWFHPFYGATYNFANGLGFLAVAAMVRRRALAAGPAIGVAFLFHPTIALFFGLAMAVIGLLRLREFGIIRLFGGGVVALAIVAAWTLAVLPSGSFASGGVDAQLYIALTRLMSSHWYPFTLGVFGERAWETLLPAIALLILAAAYASGPGRSRLTDDVAVAVAFVFGISLLGAVLAEYSGSVMIVKLALHRASAIALLLAAVLVVPRLFDDIFAAPPIRALAAAVLVAAVFWLKNGLPLLGALVLAGLITAGERRALSVRATLFRIVVILGAVAVLVVLLLTSDLPAFLYVSLFGMGTLGTPLMLLTLALLAAARFVRIPAIAALAIAASVFVWVPSVDPIFDPARLEQARQYREVQEWARENTPEDSLFMTDPAQSYGWRYFSQRPSFGTMREWLYSGWLYNTRKELMDEGLRRARTAGIDTDRLLSPELDAAERYQAAISSASTHFHEAGELWVSQLAVSYRVDYLVLDKTKSSDAAIARAVFQNQRYAIVPISPPGN